MIIYSNYSVKCVNPLLRTAPNWMGSCLKLTIILDDLFAATSGLKMTLFCIFQSVSTELSMFLHCWEKITDKNRQKQT